MALKNPAPAPESEFSNLGDYLNSVVIITPLVKDTINTVNGPAEVIKATASLFNESTNTCTGLGEVTVFWSKVKAQLEPGLDGGEPVVGRLVKRGKAFELDVLSDALLEKVEKAYSWD